MLSVAVRLAATLTTALSQPGPSADPCPVGTDQLFPSAAISSLGLGSSYETPLKRNGAGGYREELHSLYRDPYPLWADVGNEPLHRAALLLLCRYNRLLEVIAGTLKDLLKALKGLVVMSSQLELMASSLYNNTVPEMWNAKVRAPASPAARRSSPEPEEWVISHHSGTGLSHMELALAPLAWRSLAPSAPHSCSQPQAG